MITKWDDMIDGHDLFERIEELRAKNRDDDEQNEYGELRLLAEDIDEYTILINESYFQQYARDSSDVAYSHEWPYNHINWEAATEDLMDNYSSIDFDGHTFYYSN